MVVLGWQTRIMVAHGRRIRSPSPIPELLVELSNELFLLLDDVALGPDIVQERVFVVIEVGLVVGLRFSSR